MKRIIRKISSLMRRINESFKRTFDINSRIKRSNWYHSEFPHLDSYEGLQRNMDVLCIGSTPAKFSIDFKYCPTVKGANLAILPETVFYDFQVVKNYHSYLKENGTFIFVLCPFTLLKDKYRKEDGNLNYMNIRYYPILHRALIDNFSYDIFNKWVKHPYKLGVRAWISAFRPKRKSQPVFQEKCYLTDDDMKRDAGIRIGKWKKEFNLNRLEWCECSEQLKKNVNNNIDIIKSMLFFNKERNYKSVIVIPPFSNELTSLIPPDFIKNSLFAPLTKLGIKVLTYWGSEHWGKRDLYKDSFIMNDKGRRELTIDIIKRLKGDSIL